jgi:hypothetical protein
MDVVSGDGRGRSKCNQVGNGVLEIISLNLSIFHCSYPRLVLIYALVGAKELGG